MHLKELSPCHLFFILPLLFSATSAFNITEILSHYSDFTSFNSLLTQTQLADQINSRQTITVLAVDNGSLSPISGQPIDVITKVLSVHVLLDYFDVQKLQHLPSKTTMITTLFQASGLATGMQGFVNVTVDNAGGVTFASANPGSGRLNANLVKAITAQPYNISIVQVSTVILPSGIVPGTNSSNATSPAPGGASAPSATPPQNASASPALPPKSTPPASSTVPPAATPQASPASLPALTPSGNATSPSSPPSSVVPPSAEEPAANAPSDFADSPFSSPSPAPAPLNSAVADSPLVDRKSASGRLSVGVASAMGMILSLFWIVSCLG